MCDVSNPLLYDNIKFDNVNLKKQLNLVAKVGKRLLVDVVLRYLELILDIYSSCVLGDSFGSYFLYQYWQNKIKPLRGLFRFAGAGTGSRTLVSSLGRIHNSRYTIPAGLALLYHISVNMV